jgi:hypothetical protein
MYAALMLLLSVHAALEGGELWQSARHDQRVGEGVLEVLIHDGGVPLFLHGFFGQSPTCVVKVRGCTF